MMASCTLHEMHKPQVPMAVITASHVALNAVTISSAAVRE
jgi:hypothetical protein